MDKEIITDILIFSELIMTKCLSKYLNLSGLTSEPMALIHPTQFTLRVGSVKDYR